MTQRPQRRTRISPTSPANGGSAEGADSRAEAAAEALGPEAELIARHDPMSFGLALGHVGAAIVADPIGTWRAGLRFTGRLLAGAPGVAARALGVTPPPSLEPEPKDRRFADPAWERNPWFFAQRQGYLAWSHLMHELATAGDLDERTADKAAFAVGLIVDALSPTNFFVSNPVAIRKAIETRGESVLRGVGNFCNDVATNGGWPRQVDNTAFELGRDLAVTPGKVVFRNEIMELIQYGAQTDTVFEVPLLLSPPWINKYYIMDLAPGRSFVEWAVQRGHTVFVISYRNPDESLRDVTLDDYLINGPRQALDIVGDITGADEVNMAGLCVGGTLTVALLAYLAAADDRRVRTATLLNTLVDFSEPGPLGAFTDAVSVRRQEKRMAEKGFVDAADMGNIFNSLRANELVWNYVASNWLMGESPPAFDILAWNADGIRLPAAMHSFYLRSCYVKNELATDKMTLAGTRLHLGDISAEVYVVAAVQDHIVPWKSSYAITQLLDAPVRFVLTSSGHVAGIVNPPGPKPRRWVNDDKPAQADDWLAGATEVQGSWWEDWADWIATRAGKRQPPPAIGSATYPPIAEAPGTYIHG